MLRRGQALFVLAIALCLRAPVVRAADPGASLFSRKCSSCHHTIGCGKLVGTDPADSTPGVPAVAAHPALPHPSAAVTGTASFAPDLSRVHGKYRGRVVMIAMRPASAPLGPDLEARHVPFEPPFVLTPFLRDAAVRAGP